MRQLLCSSRGVLVARAPRPAVQPGMVLVRLSYSLVSAGTELAPLRAASAELQTGGIGDRAVSRMALARTYVGKAVRNPRLAASRLQSIARRRLRPLIEGYRNKFQQPIPGDSAEQILEWQPCSAASFQSDSTSLQLVSDTSPGSYQAISRPVTLRGHSAVVLQLKGELCGGRLGFGLLSDEGCRWVGQREYSSGPLDDELIIRTSGEECVQAVIATCGGGSPVRLQLKPVRLRLLGESDGAQSLGELDDQGWNIGYSAAGEIVAVGEGVRDLSVGDRVACAGAGYASHAEYVSVPRNLVAPVPAGCDCRTAATTTVGTIALQGVRRAEPQFGETIAVIGLGLIGQLTGQLLRASGCHVIGLDLDNSRVARATGTAVEEGTDDGAEFARLISDRTGGHGADCTIITAAARTNAVINGAMQYTRRKGRVVVVGDVGLKLERADFYRKEIDLRMSTSYGPGRYDNRYEAEGIDYPYAYVRWTLNRNMQAYLQAAAGGRIQVNQLIDRIVPMQQAPETYREMADSPSAPLGVLIEYPGAESKSDVTPDSTRLRVRGHRKAPAGRLNYALVGAGAFGTSMLVPLLERRSDVFFLRGVVSRDAVRGGNYVRAQRVEVFASELDAILDDPDFHLVVIATRHHEHASQVARSLRAGKHVFVEKPLALSWQELEDVVRAHAASPAGTTLMVGFNRRFSPALDKVRELLSSRRSPLVINYRVNAGMMPQDSWVHGRQGGGRNLGEACHMYDVFRSLTGSPVREVMAACLNPGVLPLNRNDNFSATVTYEDGSLANLVYTALGPKTGLGKERLEIYVDGEAYLIDDFHQLLRTSDGKLLWSASKPDKGHQKELNLLADSLRNGSEPPIPFEELIETSAVALEIEELLTGGAMSCADAC